MVLRLQIVCSVLFSVCLPKSNGANILYLAGVPSPSHALWNFKIVEALADRGHNLTVLSVDKAKNPIKNAHILDMEKIYSLVYDSGTADLGVLSESTVFDDVFNLHNFFYLFCNVKNQTEGFKRLLAYPDNFKFDLVINDFTIHGCLVGFLHKFNYPPMINVSPYKYSTSGAEVFGGHQYPGYIPRPGFPFTTNMKLTERLENTAVTLYELFYRRYIFLPKFNKLVSEMFGIKDIPCTFDLAQRAVLTLLNTHSATDYPAPLPPSVIPVGGLQISDPKPIPEELEHFIQKSKKGAVLISFGTNVNKNILNEEKQKLLIGVVKKFPEYNFLWKFEIDPSEGKLPNLLVKKWLPQNDLLAHTKIKAFISHCGGLSTHEAYWYGVPIVAVPVFMDQHSPQKTSNQFDPAPFNLRPDEDTYSATLVSSTNRSLFKSRLDSIGGSSMTKSLILQPTSSKWGPDSRCCALYRTHNATRFNSVLNMGFFRHNANGLLSAGVAIKVDFHTITAKSFESAVRNILENPAYTEVMKLASFRFRTRPMKPLDTAIWWIEYILKDPNPKHLQSPVIDIGTIKSNCYDLMFYAFLVAIIIILVVRKIVNTACRLLNAGKSTKKIKKN